MPGGDKTGPEERGPLTGRQMGYCNSNRHQGFMEQKWRFRRRIRGRFHMNRGFGRGMGYGQGYRYMEYPTEETSGVSEKTLIENEIRMLRDQISSLEEKLTETPEK